MGHASLCCFNTPTSYFKQPRQKSPLCFLKRLNQLVFETESFSPSNPSSRFHFLNYLMLYDFGMFFTSFLTRDAFIFAYVSLTNLSEPFQMLPSPNNLNFVSC